MRLKVGCGLVFGPPMPQCSSLRIAGYRYLPLLAQALDVHASRLDEATVRAS
jgi:hypothetical protein